MGEGTHKMAAVVHAGLPGEEPASMLGGGLPPWRANGVHAVVLSRVRDSV